MSIGSGERPRKPCWGNEGGRRKQVASSPLMLSLLRQQMGTLRGCPPQDTDPGKVLKAGVRVKACDIAGLRSGAMSKVSTL